MYRKREKKIKEIRMKEIKTLDNSHENEILILQKRCFVLQESFLKMLIFINYNFFLNYETIHYY